MKKRIAGPIIAPYLPFNVRGEIDEVRLQDHLEIILNARPSALYCLGEVEEFAAMPVEQRKYVAEAITKIVAQSCPVVINIGTTVLAQTVELAVHSEEIGAHAVYCVPPYYYILDDRALIKYFRNVASSISIPLHLYNTPEGTKIDFTPNLLVELGKIPRIEAVKDSSGDLVKMQEYIDTSGLDIFVGGDALHLPGLVIGAAGNISGAVGAVFPELPVKLWESFQQQDLDKAIEIQKKMTALYRILIDSYPNWIQTVKEAIKIVWEIDMGKDIVGYSSLSRKDIEKLTEHLREISI